MKLPTRGIIIGGFSGAIALSAVSCKREARSFHMPPSASEPPESVSYDNPVRPGPITSPTASSTQPVSELQLSREPYGTQFANNAQAQSDGERLYESFNCVGCHAHGGGGMAPPLLDRKWIYGSDPDQVYRTILEGRPNGMPSFRGRIADYQLWEITAYVLSLSGHANSNAASGREDHLRAQPPPNSMSAKPPLKQPEPTTGPAGNQVPGATTQAQTQPEAGK